MAMREQMRGMTAHQRHKFMMSQYVNFYGGKMPPPPKEETLHTDFDVLRDTYRFIREEAEDAEAEDRWAVRLAKRYYAKLYREYAIVDLSRYKEDKLGLRWRTEAEVVSGKGQFSCGARGCFEARGLATFEVPFGYTEAGQRKEALVKVRVCPEHALQLNYRKNKEVLKAQRRAQERAQRKQQRDGEAEQSGSDSAEKQTAGGPAEEPMHSKRQKHRDGDASADAPRGHEIEGKRRTEDSRGSAGGTAGRISHDSSRSKHSRQHPTGIVAEQRISREGRVHQAAEGSKKLKVSTGTNLDAEVDTFLREMFP